MKAGDVPHTCLPSAETRGSQKFKASLVRETVLEGETVNGAQGQGARPAIRKH